jgi:hypothetical protein
MTQLVQFEGQTHAFPDDFSSADIATALSSAHGGPSAPEAAASPAIAGGLSSAPSLPSGLAGLNWAGGGHVLRTETPGKLLGDGVRFDGGDVYYKGPNGALLPTDDTKHMVVQDPSSGKLQVFEKTVGSRPATGADMAKIGLDFAKDLPLVGSALRLPQASADFWARKPGATQNMSDVLSGMAITGSMAAPRGAIGAGPAGTIERLENERLALPPPERPGAAAGGAGGPPPPPPPGGGMGGGSALPPGGRGQAMVQALSPEARAMAADALERGGVSPANVEALNAQAHPETLLAELTPSLQGEIKGLVSEPGTAKNVFSQALDARQAATPARLDQALTDVFGERANVAQQVRDLRTTQANKSTPLYDAWSKTIVPPTPELQALMPRLEAAGAVTNAQNRLGIKGLPAQQSIPGAPSGAAGLTLHDQGLRSGAGPAAAPSATAAAPIVGPTARAYDFMKQHLDARIQKALNQGGQAGLVHDLYELKGALVAAIDNHPDQKVAGIWKAGREAYAAPERILDAQRMGNNFFSPRNSLDEMQLKLAGATEAEKEGFRSGLRDAASHVLEGSPRGDANLRSQVSSIEAKRKIAWAVGPQRAGWFAKAIEHEAEFPKAKEAMIKGSDTAPRIAGAKYWTPQPSTSPIARATEVLKEHGPAVAAAEVAGHAIGLPGVATHAVAGAAATWQHFSNKGALAQFEKIRNEVAPIFTLRGADRAGALRELLNGGGGRDRP